MERPSDVGSNPPDRATVDPGRYVRDADLALQYGSREDAIALIAEAYLAFDLLLAECESIRSMV